MAEELGVIEWFSGTGGMHYALRLAAVPAKVLVAIDINEAANSVYSHNLGQAPVAKNIEKMPLGWTEQWKADAWLMSPPCQPYTQGGKQLDDRDPRAEGLLNLLSILPRMEKPPRFIFLENVPYFEMSNCHALLLETLLKMEYLVEEYMVAPTDPMIGIPNRRKRYYLMARKRGARLGVSELNGVPFGMRSEEKIRVSLGQALERPNLKEYPKNRPLSSYLSEQDNNSYIVPIDYIRSAKNFRFDIVKPGSPSCATFTKAYGTKYVIGSGSFIQTREFRLEYEPDDQEKLALLGLRFFKPMEIAALHAFPEEFSFPEGLTRIQKYRVLGNGLNIAVVASLLQRLFFCPRDMDHNEM